MQLRFNPHAVERMQERRLSVAEIESVITAPDGKIRQTRDKMILYKKLSRRTDNLVAAVVVEAVSDQLIEVVTVLVNFEVRK